MSIIDDAPAAYETRAEMPDFLPRLYDLKIWEVMEAVKRKIDSMTAVDILSGFYGISVSRPRTQWLIFNG